jgi:hypothetical protein
VLKILRGLEQRLAPAEQVFFRWLSRVVVAALLVGSAWIDDAPPLELAAMIIAGYVAIRVVIQYGEFHATAPFQNHLLKSAFAVLALALLGLSFLAVVIFVERLALLTGS